MVYTSTSCIYTKPAAKVESFSRKSCGMLRDITTSSDARAFVFSHLYDAIDAAVTTFSFRRGGEMREAHRMHMRVVFGLNCASDHVIPFNT